MSEPIDPLTTVSALAAAERIHTLLRNLRRRNEAWDAHEPTPREIDADPDVSLYDRNNLDWMKPSRAATVETMAAIIVEEMAKGERWGPPTDAMIALRDKAVDDHRAGLTEPLLPLPDVHEDETPTRGN